MTFHNMVAIGQPKPTTYSQCVADRRESSKQEIRSCPGKGRQEATGSEQNCGRGSNTGRSGMEETRGEEGREGGVVQEEVTET